MSGVVYKRFQNFTSGNMSISGLVALLGPPLKKQWKMKRSCDMFADISAKYAGLRCFITVDKTWIPPTCLKPRNSPMVKRMPDKRWRPFLRLGKYWRLFLRSSRNCLCRSFGQDIWIDLKQNCKKIVHDWPKLYTITKHYIRSFISSCCKIGGVRVSP